MPRPRQRQKRERKEVSDDDQEPESKDSKKSEEESENKSDSNVIMRLPNIVRATVINRPSKVVRSPYMADIIVEGWRHDLPSIWYLLYLSMVSGVPGEVLCHSPALGCAGLILPGSQVLVTPKTGATKSKYRFVF